MHIQSRQQEASCFQSSGQAGGLRVALTPRAAATPEPSESPVCSARECAPSIQQRSQGAEGGTASTDQSSERNAL